MERSKSITITWLGHACFCVESEGYTVILDPYQPGAVPGLAPLSETADQVLCSHGHGDHNAAEIITLEKGRKSPFRITGIDTFHDDQKGALRGTNRIHILDNGSLKAAHLGDLGCELTEEQKAQLTGLDVIMIPVGGFYTIDARQAKALVDELRPRVVIPCITGERILATTCWERWISLRNSAIWWWSIRTHLWRSRQRQNLTRRF